MSNKNELDWEVYEAITKFIYEALGDRDGIKVKGYSRLLFDWIDWGTGYR
jgi:hypothetical protein